MYHAFFLSLEFLSVALVSNLASSTLDLAEDLGPVLLVLYFGVVFESYSALSPERSSSRGL